jgi:hypothetical protein
MKEASVVVILVVIGVLVFRSDKPKSDSREQEIQQLKSEIEELKQTKKTEHHYELRPEGFRTFRFDSGTGETCIQLTSKEDWKKPDTIRQGCQFVDFLGDNPSTRRMDQADCFFLNDKAACARYINE